MNNNSNGYEISDSLRLYKEELHNLLERVNRVLTSEKISYFAIYGTCLGAVRHGGMIPWDGDVDIAVKREVVIKAVKALAQSNEQLYIDGYAKAVMGYALRLRIFNRVTAQSTLEHKRAYIDLYIIDSVEKNRILFLVRQCFVIGLFRIIERREKRGRGLKKSLFHILSDMIVLPFKMLSSESVRMIAVWAYSSTRESKMVKISGGFRKRYLSESFRSSARVKFDGLDISIPIGYEEHLKTAYGDWRELPPVEKRGSNTFGGENGEWNVKIPRDEERMIIRA